jgi:hypothetical protein
LRAPDKSRELRYHLVLTNGRQLGWVDVLDVGSRNFVSLPTSM